MAFKISGSQSFEELHGMITSTNAIKSDAEGCSSLGYAQFTLTPTGANKGTVKVELLDSAGTVVKALHASASSQLTVYLLENVTSGDQGSTATRIQWAASPADFSAGRVRITSSGKIAGNALVAVTDKETAITTTINGSGNYETTIPFQSGAAGVTCGPQD